MVNLIPDLRPLKDLALGRQKKTMRFLDSDSNLNFTAALGPLSNFKWGSMSTWRSLKLCLSIIPFAHSGFQFAKLESDRSHISSYKTCTVEIPYPYPPYFIHLSSFFSSSSLRLRSKHPHTTLLTRL